MKSNHGSNMNVIIHNGIMVYTKQRVTPRMLRSYARKWLKIKFHECYHEMQYRKITPYIIFEKYLGRIMEFKILCFYGKAKLIVTSERIGDFHKPKVRQTMYRPDWTFLNIPYTPKRFNPLIRSKPSYLNKILEIAEQLSESYDHVRIDLGVTEDEDIYFGEFTFTPRAGAIHLLELEPEISEYWI